MVCPYCQHPDTAVTNSRQHRKEPRIWRRRHCKRCKTTFTTYEHVAEKELPQVNDRGSLTIFSLPRLMLSIYTVLPECPTRPDDAHALAMTVQSDLASSTTAGQLQREDIIQATYSVIRLFNPTSGLTYGVKHGVITPESFRN